ncbi:type II toxin-antitoxin system CcdA family antitoxin [Sulfitobacter sp. JB4-11]|uniref:type II toxin-antitoxin system CcdA family antitoxin n=1 Tax=Sulfitobacter rhodophyticola TaxID=3238304 RepID=UPI0035193A17
MGIQGSGKKATNVTLDQALLKDAKALGVNVSQAAEKGLDEAVRQAKGEAWQRENAEAMEAWGKWVEENGLPLEKYRMF